MKEEEKVTTDAVKILYDRYVGNDPEAIKAFKQALIETEAEAKAFEQSIVDDEIEAEMVIVREGNKKAVIDALCFIPILIGLLCGTDIFLLPTLLI